MLEHNNEFYTFNQYYEKECNMKRKMSLDFNFTAANEHLSDRLCSPDMKMLKLSSPELANFLNQHGDLATPGQLLYPKNVTQEQELYIREFDVTLQELCKTKSTYETSSPSNCGGDDLTVMSNVEPYSNECNKYEQQQSYQLDSNYFSDYNMSISMNIKEEPQAISTSNGCLGEIHSIVPIDMVAQEKIKLERKRQRNRLAATKCRKRKLEKISVLENKVEELRADNCKLNSTVIILKNSIGQLMEQLTAHVNSGCQVVLPNDNVN